MKRLQTPAVEAAQRAAYGKVASTGGVAGAEVRGLRVEEVAFLAERDSFYMASVSESGWPYLQHRGGPKGFLKVVGERRLACLDFEGNRQLLSVGNIAVEDRVSLFLMDYRARERLKVLGRARFTSLEAEPEIAGHFSDADRARARRLFILEVEGYDWNCPKFITQRFTREEVQAVVQPMAERIEQLETELRELRER